MVRFIYRRGTYGSVSCFDEIALYPKISEPRAIGTMDSFTGMRVAAEYKNCLRKYRLQRLTFVHARIRSNALVAGITVKHYERMYSETDRALIGTIAAVTSLVLRC